MAAKAELAQGRRRPQARHQRPRARSTAYPRRLRRRQSCLVGIGNGGRCRLVHGPRASPFAAARRGVCQGPDGPPQLARTRVLAAAWWSTRRGSPQRARWLFHWRFVSGWAPRASWFLAAWRTASGVKPNLSWRSFRGAEAPKVLMAMMAPVVPTQRSPAEGGALLDDDAGGDRGREDGVAVLGGLPVEQLHRRHGHDAGVDAVGGELLVGGDGQADFGAGGDQDDLGGGVGVAGEDVGAAGDARTPERTSSGRGWAWPAGTGSARRGRGAAA